MGEMTGKGLTRVVMLNNTVYEVKETPDNIRTNFINGRSWVQVPPIPFQISFQERN